MLHSLPIRIELLPLLGRRGRWVRRAVLVFMLWFMIPMVIMTFQAMDYY